MEKSKDKSSCLFAWHIQHLIEVVLKVKRGRKPTHPPQNRQMKELCLSSKISTNSSWPGIEKAGT